MIYTWKNGSQVRADAQTAGNVCKQLEDAGNLTPSALVDISRPEDAPLHGCFEWRDDVAAERYRESQARYIIRSLEMNVEEHQPVRAFMKLSASVSNSYQATDVLMKDSDSRELLLEQALRELNALRVKYAALKELADVFSELEKAKKAMVA